MACTSLYNFNTGTEGDGMLLCPNLQAALTSLQPAGSYSSVLAAVETEVRAAVTVRGPSTTMQALLGSLPCLAAAAYTITTVTTQQQQGPPPPQQQQAGVVVDQAVLQQLQCQQFVLLQTCLKLAAWARYDTNSNGSCQVQVILAADFQDVWTLVSAVVQAAAAQLQAALRSRTDNASSSSGGSSSAAALWALLLARGLLESGLLLLTMAAEASAITAKLSTSDDSQALLDIVMPDPDLSFLSQAVTALVQLLPVLHLSGESSAVLVTSTEASSSCSAAAPDTSSSSSSSGGSKRRQQLLEQAVQVQQALAAVSSEAGQSSAAADTTEGHSSLLAQQLVCFGEALCAVLPSKLCCNHSRCSSLARLSEAELVGGKGCVCAR
jgi:hypothetical protein